MQKSILVYVLTALMLSTAAIYFVAAAEESTESEEPEEQGVAVRGDSDDDDDAKVASSSEEESEGIVEDENTLATQVETAFFAIVGGAYASVGLWMLKDKGKTNAPYLIAIAGSISIIGLYVASRTMDLPIVGLQDDVGAIDITSKVLQVFIIGVAASIVNFRHKEIRARQHS